MTGAYPFDDQGSPCVLDVVVRVALQPETKVLQHGRLFQGKLEEKGKNHQSKFKLSIDLIVFTFS
jgi:hypothetical protein